MKCGSKKPVRPCCFLVLKGIFSTASTSLPQPAVSDQNFMLFYWIQTRRATAARDEMWFENASRGPAGPCCFRFVGRLFGGWIVCEKPLAGWGRRHWAAALKSGCAVAPENLALLRGGPDPAADPLYQRYLRLAGHWWEQKRSKLETRRPLGGAQKQGYLRQRI